MTDWTDLVLPPNPPHTHHPRVSHAYWASLVIGPRSAKPPKCRDWHRRKNKQPWIMIIGRSASARVQHRRHDQLIKRSAETFYNEHNNNLLTDGSHFPQLTTAPQVWQQNLSGCYSHFSHPDQRFFFFFSGWARDNHSMPDFTSVYLNSKPTIKKIPLKNWNKIMKFS